MLAAKQSLKETFRGVRTPTDLERRVGELDWSLQKSAGQSEQAKRLIQKQQPNQAMRDAVALWIDAGGDEELIRNVAANAPASTPANIKRALQVASNLPAEGRQFAEQIQQFFGIRAQDAIQADVMTQALTDYYTHIWKKIENMPEDLRAQITNGRVSTYFPYSRERKIPMFLNGIMAGKVPELDPANVIPYYNYALDRAIASRKFIKELSDLEAPDGRPAVSPSGRGSKVSDPSIVAGEGGGALFIQPRARSAENGDYRQVDHPALRKWKWAGTDEAGRTIMYQGDLLVHPDFYERVARFMDRGRLSPSKAAAALLRASTEVKGFKLGVFSLFHPVHVGSHALFHWTNPFKFVGSGKEINWESPQTRFAVEQGHLKLAPNPNELAQFAEGILSPGLVNKVPFIGPISREMAEWTFGKFIPELKLETFHNVYNRSKWMQEHMGLFKGLTDEELAARAGDSVNNAYGELNHLFLGKYGRSPGFQRFLRGIFLAPDFGEARLRFAGKGLTKFGHEERLALATMFATFYLGARVANLLTHGDPEWDKKRMFQVKVGDHWLSMRSVVGDLWRAINESGKFMYARLNPLYTRPFMDWIGGRDVFSGRKLSTFEKMVTRPAEQLVPIHLTGLTRDDQKVWESFIGAMGLATQRDLPERDIKMLLANWLRESKDPKLREIYERRDQSIFPPSDYLPMKRALSDNNLPKARKEYEKLLATKTGKQIAREMYPFSTDKEGYVKPKMIGQVPQEANRQFLQSLSPKERELYDQALKERRENYQRFLEMFKQP